MNYFDYVKLFIVIYRVWWIIAFIFSFLLYGFLIHNAWVKWDENPIIVTIVGKAIPVSAIPFPTVTICPETKTNVRLLNFTKIYDMLKSGNQAKISDKT